MLETRSSFTKIQGKYRDSKSLTYLHRVQNVNKYIDPDFRTLSDWDSHILIYARKVMYLLWNYESKFLKHSGIIRADFWVQIITSLPVPKL